jgi:formiminoglutamase
MSFTFTKGSTSQIAELTTTRTGETKLGETISTIVNSKTRFVILGIEESTGPQTNFGLSGSENGFHAFLKRFVNIQSNQFLNGEEICFLGSIKTDIPFSSIEAGNRQIAELDKLVYSILKENSHSNVIPIVIGGGHNNAYPLIKAVSAHLKSPINVINLDPHADCRKLEGRHSGNPFSYAIHDQILQKYAVIGLHKAYNSSFILNFLSENNCYFTFYDDYLLNRSNFLNDTQHFLSNSLLPVGIELDLDCIAFMPSSAFTPSGWSVDEARAYIQTCAKQSKSCYLHLPEGAPKNSDEEKIVGKTLSYLVYDFILGKNK